MNQLDEIAFQDEMIRRQVIERGISDERVIAALRAVPRGRFFQPEVRGAAYDDRAAPIGHGQTISQPYMVALMTARLNAQPTDRVLEIGTGSGYHTAILSKLAREVFTVERVKPLLDQAWDKLMAMGIRNVHYKFGDGTLGWPEEAPFDRILIAAGAPRIPISLLTSQLGDGGIAVVPVGAADEQTLLEIRRDGNHLASAEICGCRFVKLIGHEGWADDK